ncbi:outer membrane protein [Pontibaca methylaminivorans]|uniref:Opacity protein n=1 Tax=Pontibaca methylaminivorans TaxID=515897 RepID=A0A1R3W9C6_9RHOB|nr:hypothetical protein [Pontibaca methylaminivorans]SIT74585.1 hypothetical protein SAMN05421849_0182 [Pontibaca methylaminivorans]
MRKLPLTPAALALLAAPAVAASLDALPPQPVVLPPMQVTAPYSWTGPYAGISAGTTRTRHTREAHPYTKYDLIEDVHANGCGDDPWRLYEVDYGGGNISTMGCSYILGIDNSEDYRAFPVVGEGAAGSETARSSHATRGLFAGYRHQFGTGVVLGAEAAWHRAETDQIEAKAQAGWALGRVLPFATAGWEFESGEALYGVGIDYGLTNRWIVGTEYARFGDSDRLTARIAVRF